MYVGLTAVWTSRVRHMYGNCTAPVRHMYGMQQMLHVTVYATSTAPVRHMHKVCKPGCAPPLRHAHTCWKSSNAKISPPSNANDAACMRQHQCCDEHVSLQLACGSVAGKCYQAVNAVQCCRGVNCAVAVAVHSMVACWQLQCVLCW